MRKNSYSPISRAEVREVLNYAQERSFGKFRAEKSDSPSGAYQLSFSLLAPGDGKISRTEVKETLRYAQERSLSKFSSEKTDNSSAA